MDTERRCDYCQDKTYQCVDCWAFDMRIGFPDNPKAWND